MATKLFIGGITWGTTDEMLAEAFAQAGEVVSAQVMKDRETGRSRGFAFVEMASDEAAQEAIKMWNDQELDGRQIIVNEARPREERPAGNFNRGRNDRRQLGSLAKDLDHVPTNASHRKASAITNIARRRENAAVGEDADAFGFGATQIEFEKIVSVN